MSLQIEQNNKQFELWSDLKNIPGYMELDGIHTADWAEETIKYLEQMLDMWPAMPIPILLNKARKTFATDRKKYWMGRLNDEA